MNCAGPSTSTDSRRLCGVSIETTGLKLSSDTVNVYVGVQPPAGGVMTLFASQNVQITSLPTAVI